MLSHPYFFLIKMLMYREFNKVGEDSIESIKDLIKIIF